ncbi:MAG: FGGY family carbohydrate kinase [Gammaproteobacteria bacterium]
MPPSPSPLYLAVDQGGHASRALIYDGKGRLLNQAHESITPTGNGEHREYDGELLLQSVQHAINQAVATLGSERNRLCAAALATQRSNIACWDRYTGMPLAPVIAWQDRRAAPFVEKLPRTAKQRIQRLTGLPPSAHYGAGKLRWCLDHLPAVQEALAGGRLAMGPMASYLIQRLTAQQSLLADPVNASRTQLWALQRRDWSAELLHLFGIPATVLPPCVASRHEFGTLKVGGQKLPLEVVTGDQAAALFAAGRPCVATAHVTLGTGAFILRPTGASPQSCPGLLSSIIHEDRQEVLYALEGTVNGAGSALQWFEQIYGQQVDYQQLEILLATENDPPLFLNGIGGLGTPFMKADFSSRFIGKGDSDQRLVAVVESIVFLLQLNLERMAGSSAGPLARIAAGGGLARLDGLCQRLADLSGLPVERSKAHETTALGLLRLLAPTSQQPPPPPADHFEPRDQRALMQRYERWRALLYDAVGSFGEE